LRRDLRVEFAAALSGNNYPAKSGWSRPVPSSIQRRGPCRLATIAWLAELDALPQREVQAVLDCAAAGDRADLARRAATALLPASAGG
jgi:hypothetical protein